MGKMGIEESSVCQWSLKGFSREYPKKQSYTCCSKV